MNETNYTDDDGVAKEIGSDQSGAPIGAMQRVTISFGSIDFSKNWPWYISGIWVPNGTTIDRLYGYQLELDINDNFQNGYSPQLTSGIFIDYRVSNTKIAALSVAGGLM